MVISCIFWDLAKRDYLRDLSSISTNVDVIEKITDGDAIKKISDGDVVKEMTVGDVIQDTVPPTVDAPRGSSFPTVFVPTVNLIQTDPSRDVRLIQSQPEQVCHGDSQTAPRDGSIQSVSPVRGCHTKSIPGNEQSGMGVEDADWPAEKSVGDVIFEGNESAEKLREGREAIRTKLSIDYTTCKL